MAVSPDFNHNRPANPMPPPRRTDSPKKPGTVTPFTTTLTQLTADESRAIEALINGAPGVLLGNTMVSDGCVRCNECSNKDGGIDGSKVMFTGMRVGGSAPA